MPGRMVLFYDSSKGSVARRPLFRVVTYSIGFGLIIMKATERVANQNYGCVFLSPTAMFMFTVAVLNLQRATVNLPIPSLMSHEAQFII